MTNLVQVMNNKNQVVTTSRQVAETFEKRHDHVLRDVRTLEISLPNFGDYFYESTYTNSRGRQYTEYLINKDGFSLLVMGFTGNRALEFKVQYIEAFNAMEKKLKELEHTTAQHVPTAFEEMVLHNAKNSYNYNTYTSTDLARCFGLSSQVINHFLLTTDVIKLGGHINQFGEHVPYTEDGKYEKYVVGDKYKDEGLVLVEEFSTNVSLRLTLKGALFVYELLTTLGYEELRVADNVASYAISDIAKELGMKARELNAELLSKGFYELDDNGKKVINPRYNGYGLKAGTRLSPIARKEIMSLITTGESIFNDKGAIEYVESGRVPVLEGHPKMVSIYGTNPALRLLLN